MIPALLHSSAWIRNGVALATSLGSVFLGYLLAGHFFMAALTWTGTLGPTPAGAWYSALYFVTHSQLTLLVIGWAVLVLTLGWVGLALAGWERAPQNSSSLSSIAARFAVIGLIAGFVDVVFIAVLLIMGRLWIWWV